MQCVLSDLQHRVLPQSNDALDQEGYVQAAPSAIWLAAKAHFWTIVCIGAIMQHNHLHDF